MSVAKKVLVRMVRDPQQHPAPHSADVHEDEIANFRTGGFVTIDEATFDVPDQQRELQLVQGPEGTAQLGEPGAEPAKPAETTAPFGGTPFGQS